MPKLSEEQIRQKLIEGRNYKRLYYELKDKFDTVKADNKQLKQELAEQRHYFEGIIETQAAQIAELQTIVFGCKPSGGLPDKAKPAALQGNSAQTVPTVAHSHRQRPLPPKSTTR